MTTITPALRQGLRVEMQFSNVGRDGRSWRDIVTLDDDGILQSIFRRRVIRSKDIGYQFDLRKGKGTVYAGGRPVGTMHVIGYGVEP